MIVNITLDADVSLRVGEYKTGRPDSCRVTGQAATKQDVYKLVDRLCESLGLE